MVKNLVYLERARQLSMLLEQLRHLVDDFLLTSCDRAYRDALRIYGNLHEQSRGKVPGAEALFLQLRQYFTLHRHGRPNGAEPTEHEIERDVRALLHGTKDGDIFIENKSDTVVKGKKVIVDNTQRKPRGGVRVVESAEFREQSEE